MKILFSSHALERIKQRKISKYRILNTIENPGKTEESFKNRIVYTRKFASKTLEIITAVEKGSIIVVSAYYLETKNYEN